MSTDAGPATHEAIENVTTVAGKVGEAFRHLQDMNAELTAVRQAALDAGHTEEQVQAAQEAAVWDQPSE